MNISRLESVPLRELWPTEARDFTTWLAEYAGLSVDDWALKTNLGSYYEHDWDEMHRILKRNQRKVPKVGLDVDAYKNEAAARVRAAWETSMKTLRPLLARIEATDRLIDLIVYQLYGLTEEEIATVEGCSSERVTVPGVAYDRQRHSAPSRNNNCV
jgi:hypothetical protein